MKFAARQWVVLCLGLIAVGLGMVAFKSRVLGYPLFPDESSIVWTIQAKVNLKTRSGPVKATLNLPDAVPGFSLLSGSETFVSKGFGVTVEQDKMRREAHWAIRRASGTKTLYYRAQVFADATAGPPDEVPPFPAVPELEEPFQTALQDLVSDVRAASADIASFTAELISRLNDSDPEGNVALFTQSNRGSADLVKTARTLLSGARIPTKHAHGFRLIDDQRDAPVEEYLAVHNGQQWLYFDPVSGDQGLPDNTFIWWYGDSALAHSEGAVVSDVVVSTRKNAIDSLELAGQRANAYGSKLAEFSLQSLPLQTQSVYAILLTVPIGAFVIVVLRNLIGMRSFGTFMPVLIALAFRETELAAGLVLFTVLIALGLALRFYLEQLRLLLVPRLTAVLIIVVLLMVVVSIFSHRLGFESGLSVALFPMVIISMVIERMSIVWEERGPVDALKDGLGSLVMAALAYVIMGLPLIRHLVFVYPEILLVVLGLTIALGRYSGYRLSELFRFRELASEPGQPPARS